MLCCAYRFECKTSHAILSICLINSRMNPLNTACSLTLVKVEAIPEQILLVQEQQISITERQTTMTRVLHFKQACVCVCVLLGYA